jgi:hypothetical protein
LQFLPGRKGKFYKIAARGESFEEEALASEEYGTAFLHERHGGPTRPQNSGCDRRLCQKKRFALSEQRLSRGQLNGVEAPGSASPGA